ncbi:hypothetical protein ACSBOB_05430 [Mesorhizobium sp. ASY16-5R]|uniref:hypothetical protein n=1 Tax=Mesorhizobium sp. ASY16-5R TaxID=3445772 RepID=UPI003FA05682
MRGNSYPADFDCAWLAADRDNRLAVFTTAGCGPVPVGLLHLLNRDEGDLEPLIYRLPVVSEARILEAMPRPDCFIAFAQRGLFAYDWTDVHRPAIAERNAYELVAIPVNPTTVDRLPDELAQHARDLRLVTSRFGDARFLDVRQDLTCKCRE